MISFGKLSVVASFAFAVAACSSTTDTTGTDASTATDTGAKTDTGTVADTGTKADTGTETDTGTGDDASTCSFPASGVTGDATCDTCLETNCCSDILTCFNDSACLGTNNCLGDCSTGQSPNDGGTFDAGDHSDGGALQTCEKACLAGVSQQTLTELKAANTCLAGTCKTSCGG